VIWSDYFRRSNSPRSGGFHTKVWNPAQLAGKNKQGVDAAGGGRLEGATKEFPNVRATRK